MLIKIKIRYSQNVKMKVNSHTKRTKKLKITKLDDAISLKFTFLD